MTEYTQVHKLDMNPYGQKIYPDGNVPWREAEPPDLTGAQDERSTGILRHCSYCGSMHPADVAAAIKAGATGEWADRKYGWPHKAYFDGIPNPHAGMPESRSSRSDAPDPDEIYKWRKVQRGFSPVTGEPEYWWSEVGRPASAFTSGKFYSIHLLDANAKDLKIIEGHLGLHFEFTEDGNVRWSKTSWINISREL